VSHLLGRTNRIVPRIWLKPMLPELGLSETWIEGMTRALLTSGTILDISAQPGLWGSHLRGEEVRILRVGADYLPRLRDPQAAADQTQAELIETLSVIGRPKLDFYVLRLTRPCEDNVLDAALMSLEEARQDGLLGHFGLLAAETSLATLSNWQFRDAFEFMLIPRNQSRHAVYDELLPMAKSRRVGIVTTDPLEGTWGPESGEVLTQLSAEHPVLVPVSSPEEISAALAVMGSSPAPSP